MMLCSAVEQWLQFSAYSDRRSCYYRPRFVVVVHRRLCCLLVQCMAAARVIPTPSDVRVGSLSLYLSLSLSVSVFVSRSLSVSLSVSLPLFGSISPSVSLPLFPPPSPSIPPPLSLSLSLCLLSLSL